MTKTMTMGAKKVAELNGFGIIRCEEKKVNVDGETYGQMNVWYDVCLDNGDGDIIESFKTLNAAKKFARDR